MLERMWFSHDHVPDAVRTEMAIAVGEISANIVEHAAKDGPVRLRMEVHVLPDKVHVSFLDDGLPAAVDISQAAMPDLMAESGRGLALAHAVLDRFALPSEFRQPLDAGQSAVRLVHGLAYFVALNTATASARDDTPAC